MAQFHEIMRGAGVPYLIAVTPRVARNYLSPRDTASRPLRRDEEEMLGRLAEDGVAFALHGLDHRTRYSEPRRHSELCGLGTAAAAALLDEGLGILGELGIRPRVFVPPFNRFDAEQYPALAERFPVVCGGPETVPLMGFHATPLWRGDAVYLPAYPPLYDRAAGVGGGCRRLVERGARCLGAAGSSPALGGRGRLERPGAPRRADGAVRRLVGRLPRGRRGLPERRHAGGRPRPAEAGSARSQVSSWTSRSVASVPTHSVPSSRRWRVSSATPRVPCMS